MKKLFIFVFMLFLSFAVCFADSQKELPSQVGVVQNIQYSDEDINIQGQSIEKQVAQIKITKGLFKNEIVQVSNILTGNPAYDINVHKGDKVILHAEAKSDYVNSVDDIDYFIADIQRSHVLYFTFALFCICLVLIGRKKGLYSLVSIIATLGFVFYILVPLVLHGVNPILSAFIVGVLSTVTTVFFVGGLNAKSIAAISGTVLSLLITGILSAIAIFFAGLTGFAGEENVFLYTAHPELNFKGILAASMMLAALGALMDTSVSIASTINEIHQTDKTLDIKQLFTSGMNVGKDIIGTMSNTLILVYLGSSLPLILLSTNVDLQKFFNLNQVATEILSALTGSIAILACVPVTAIIAAILIKKSSDDVEFNFEK